MKVITIATQKGGAGKTTLATNLATKSFMDNKKTLIIDTDEQQTAYKWFISRGKDSNPKVISIDTKEKLHSLIGGLKEKGYERVYIDTQGAKSNMGNSTIELADFILIPCKASGFDAKSQRETSETVHRFGKQAAFVITQAPSRGKDVEVTKDILSGLGINTFNQQITLLKAFKDSALYSSTVIEDELKSKASKEIIDLHNWLDKHMKNNLELEELEVLANA